MVKKLMKTLLTTVTCATLVVCGTAVTAYAANNPDLCTHDGYYIVDASGGYYTDAGNNHIFHYWAEIYCMDCFGYDIKLDDIPGDHVYGDYNDNVCDYCGHDKSVD